MKPQDLVTAFVLVGSDDPPTYSALAERVGIAGSEAHAAVRRLRTSGLVDGERRVNRPALLEFLLHGLRRAFPAEIGGPTLGLKTGAAAPGVDGLPDPEFAPWVWPTPAGETRGLALLPLYPSIPEAALADPQLYTLLALTDLLRAGSAREVSHAQARLRQRFGNHDEMMKASPLDVGSPRALHAIFQRPKLAYAISKWRAESVDYALVRHPLQAQILVAYGDSLADLLSATVPNEDWASEPAYHVTIEKQNGVREMVYPTIMDAIVARRVIDELEPHIRKRDKNRVFMARTHSNSRRPKGDYSRWNTEWNGYLAATAAAAAQSELAVVIKTDITEFFPSVDRNAARQALAQRSGAHASIIGILFHCLESWLPRFGYREVNGLPLDPHDISGLIAHCVLESIDEQFEDSFELRYRRFVDDTVMFVDSEDEAKRLFEKYRRALAAIGLRPNMGKTRIETTKAFQQARHEAQFSAIDAAVDAEADELLKGLTKDILSHIDTSRPGEGGLLRRLYSANTIRETDAMVEQALVDISAPSFRGAALRYLRTTTLSKTAFRRLTEAFNAASTPVDLMIDIARTLGEMNIMPANPLLDVLTPELIAANEVVVWARKQLYVPSQKRGEGYAYGLLILVFFKHSNSEQLIKVTEELLNSGTPGHFGDPYFRMFIAYLATAAQLEDHLPSWFFHGGSSDFALQNRLCIDAVNDSLSEFDKTLNSCRYQRQGRFVISADTLPFLHILARSRHFVRKRRLGAWIVNTLEESHRPRDPATQEHLRRLQALTESKSRRTA